MRTRLATFLAVSLCCGSAYVDALCTTADAQDYSRLHLPGPLGRYFGIGYSAGYHTCEPPCSDSHSSGSHCAGPGCADLGQEVRGFAAPVYQPSPAFGPTGAAAACPQCSQPVPYSGFAPESLPAAATPSLQHAPIQQPRREPASSTPASNDPASPSDRAGFFKRLPHPSLRPQMTDLPAPAAPPKKAAVARSSILELEAR